MAGVTFSFLYEQKFLGGLKAAPNRQRAAFVVSEANLEQNRYDSRLWLYEAGKTRQLTALGKERSYVWETDETLLFAAARSETELEAQKNALPETTVYRLSLEGGEALPAFTLPFALKQLLPLADGSFLICGDLPAACPNLWQAEREQRAAYVKAEGGLKDWHHIEQLPFYFNGAGYIEGRVSRLFHYVPATAEREAVLHCLSPEKQNVGVLSLSEDRRRAYVTLAEDQKGLATRYNTLWRFDLDAPEALQSLYPQLNFDFSLVWETEVNRGAASRLFCLASDMQHYGINESPGLYELQGSEMKRLSDDEHRPYHSVGSDCRYGDGSGVIIRNGELLYTTTDRDHAVVRRLDTTGALRVFYDDGQSCLDNLVELEEGYLAVALQAQKPLELYRLKEQSLEQCSHFNSALCEKHDLTEPRLLHFSNPADIEGFVLLPPDYDETKRYPAILDIHGGPRTVYGSVLYHEMQYWAALGFIVLFTNPRGGDGRGDAFADIRGLYGGPDYEDLMSFVDAALAAYPAIDPERLGVTGGSYGGFMTNWIIGHTDRFKAAATQRSIMNWLSFYGTSDIGFDFACDQNGALTFSEEGFQKLWAHSPLRYINAAKTPTLIIHSDEDFRCPLEQGMQLFAALKERQIDTEMYIFKGENHELSRSGKPRARAERLRAISDWMCRYLMPSGSLEEQAKLRGLEVPNSKIHEEMLKAGQLQEA